MNLALPAVLLSATCLFNSTALSQEKLPLTIEKAIQIGLENSKTLHSSLMKVEYADAKSAEVNAGRLPSLKFGGSYTRLSDIPPAEVVLQLPPPAPSRFTLSPTILDNYNLRFSVQHPLFTGFRLDAASSAADFSVQASSQEYAKDKADLIYNVKNAYWSLYKAQEVQKVIEENVQQIKAHVDDVQKMMDQGMATTNDVLKVQVQLSDAQLRQIDANNQVRLAVIGLDNTLGVSLSTDIELETTIAHTPREFAPLDKLIATALDKRPDIHAMKYRVQAGEAGVTAARSGWFPQIYLVGNYYYARPNQRLFPTENIFKDTWDVGVSMSLDIWNWGTTVHQIDQAQAQVAQSKDALGQLQDGITLEITQTYLNLTQAKERIGVAQKGVDQSQENYRITHERFTEGLALNSDMLDAEVAMLQSKLNYTQALVDYELAEARLERAIGE